MFGSLKLLTLLENLLADGKNYLYALFFFNLLRCISFIKLT